MSSDLFLLDDSFFRHSTSGMFSPHLDPQFLTEPFFSFDEPPSDIFQAMSHDPNQQFLTDPFLSAANPFSSSPPIQEINKLSLGTTTQLQSLPTSEISSNGPSDFSVLDSSGLKSEECYVAFDTSPHIPSLLPNNSYDNEKAMQRSFSSRSLDRRQSFPFQPRFNSVLELEVPFQIQVMGSLENSKFTGPMRRVCSTGDLQRIKRTQSSHGFSSSPLGAENLFTEEGSFKVGRYSAEERKQRIHRYRSKRTQRNFNRTIKYACRKTLADSRPRVRGRFARNDETGEIPKVTGFHREEEDEEEFWVDGLHEDEDEVRIRGGGGFVDSFSPTQIQFNGF